MKRRFFYVAGLCSLSVVAGAESIVADRNEESPEWRYYAGATLGQARGSVGESTMNERMAELGYDAQARVDGQNRTAWGLFAGYQWTSMLGFEAGYTDLGEVRTRLSGVTSDIEAYLEGATEVHPRTISGYEFAVLARWPITEDLDIFGRGGVLVGDSKYRAKAISNSASRTEEETEWTYGLGVDFDFSERWALRASWSRYQVEGEDIDFLGASILYRFSQRAARPSEASPVSTRPAQIDTPPPDRDGDGVEDRIDQCADTASALQVDRSGCPLDSDLDGVSDYRDQCLGSEAGSEVDEQGCAIVEPPDEEALESIELKVLFDTDSAIVKPAYHSEIQQVADFLARNVQAQVIIEGHTDARGNADYNVKLSQRRAEAVRQVLIEHMGVAPERVSAVGFGGQRLLREGDTKEAHDANRRVVATIVRNGW